jgi:D-tyrosyl-tRNA(Tyr) deacylase
MRAVIMRVARASVEVGGVEISSINRGLLILLGIGKEDTREDAIKLANKIPAMKVFENEKAEFSSSIEDIKGEVLVVSQVTLYGSLSKGRKPSFDDCAKKEIAEALYRDFISELKSRGLSVKEGKFGAHMHIYIENDGPVTFIIDTKNK